jgi:hypothetical protein
MARAARAAALRLCLAAGALSTGAAAAAFATTPAAVPRTTPGAARQPALSHPTELTPVFERHVARHLLLPVPEQALYRTRLLAALAAAGVVIDRLQFAVLVDRNEHVQAAMLWWLAPGVSSPARDDERAGWIGAAPASTGLPRGFEHFETPQGVFEHRLANPDFRAEGTKNAWGVRGYGDRGMRVYDFGWITAPRAWTSGEQPMRLQMHATDPAWLEPRLGERASKGCIRIPAAMNELIDRYGVLDADYDQAAASGRLLWQLRRDRIVTPWAGRWLVVVDTARRERPAWSPRPGALMPAPDPSPDEAPTGRAEAAQAHGRFAAGPPAC